MKLKRVYKKIKNKHDIAKGFWIAYKFQKKKIFKKNSFDFIYILKHLKRNVLQFGNEKLNWRENFIQ